MIIHLYKNNSPANKINKTITHIEDKTIKLRNDFNINSPYLIFDRYTTLTTAFDYVLLDNRYYFIKNQTRLNNRLVRVDLDLDPLMTFKNFINNSNINITGISDFDVANQKNSTVNTPKSTLLTSDKGLSAGNTLILTTTGYSGD